MRLTKSERAWVLYDVGNSAFTMLCSTIIPIFLHALTGQSDSYFSTWSYTLTAATVIAAAVGLFIGSLSDHRGMKKPLFLIVVLLGAVCCGLMGFARTWQVYLFIFVCAKILYSNSLVLYDSMLTDVSEDSRMDRVSSAGYAWGYIGSCIPFGAALVLYIFYKKIGISFNTAMELGFLIVAVWWFAMALPLLFRFRQKRYVESSAHPALESVRRLAATFRKARENRHIFLFLLAFFFYIDGVYTIIDEASAYGTALHIDSVGMLLALLLTQFVAFPFSILFGRFAGKFPVSRLIKICIAMYFVITVYAVFLNSLADFYILACAVGVFQGGVQSLSRSYFARLIPPEQSGEFFGLYDICGKGASLMGTLLVAVVSQVTGSDSLGVAAVALTFVIGFVLFSIDDRMVRERGQAGQRVRRGPEGSGAAGSGAA